MVPTLVPCGVPSTAVIRPTARGEFVSKKVAAVGAPLALAVTLYVPATEFAVKTGAMATPETFVTTVFTPASNEPLAPEEGASNVTAIPLTGFPAASFTVPESRVPKGVPTFVDWGVPAVAVTVEAGPNVTVIVPVGVGIRSGRVARIRVVPTIRPVRTALLRSALGTRSPAAIPPVAFARDQASAATFETKLSLRSRAIAYAMRELPDGRS
jgi:hypothetical protein